MCDEMEEPEIDYDGAYETMRDDTSEVVEEEVKEVFKKYVEKRQPYLIYYHDRPELFWRHLKGTCEFELELLNKRSMGKK